MNLEQADFNQIFIEIKNYIDGIKKKGVNENKKDEASGLISFVGMILDEVSSSLKKSKLIFKNINQLEGAELDPQFSNLLNELLSYFSADNNKIIEDRLDELADYCNKVFMELMAGNSCAIPEMPASN
jgi:molecular chaperone GrpE (heat shock protein)